MEKSLLAVDIGSVWPLAKPAEFQSLGGMVSYFLPNILLVGGIIFFILTVIAGVGMIAGAGNDNAQAKEKSKTFLTSALIGLIIMFGAFWIIQIINFVTRGSLDLLLKGR